MSKQIIINKENFIDFIKSMSFYNMKIGDSATKALEYFNNKNIDIILDKKYYLISYSNIEIILFEEKIYSIHFEINKPSPFQIYVFNILNFTDIINIIKSANVTIIKIRENINDIDSEIKIKNVDLNFYSGWLTDIFFNRD